MRLSLLSLFFIFFCYCLQAQYLVPYGIKAIGKSKTSTTSVGTNGGVMWVRFAPTRQEVWLAGIKNGYIIERFIISADGSIDKTKVVLLTPTPLKPISKTAFEKLPDPLADAAAEVIYNASPVATSSHPTALYEKKMNEENRFSMALLMCDLSQNVALASGLMLIDNQNLVNGVEYAYRIKLAVIPANMPAVEDGIAIVRLAPEIPLIAPVAPAVIFDNKQAILKWNVQIHKGVYGSYWVERSVDGKNFKATSDIPFSYMSEDKDPINAVYADSLPNNKQKYYYRLIGINAFGEKSPPSTVVSGKGKDDLFAAVTISKIDIIENKSASITWKFPEAYLGEIKGFKVRYASSANAPFVDAHRGLLSKGERDFKHTPPFLNTYYYVQAIDNDGSVRSQSFPFLAQKEDHDPPAQIEDLVAKIDTLGVVTLRWKAGIEPDLQGYRVFRTNGSREEFMEITQRLLTKNIYRDTLSLQVLSKEVYYKVMSMDMVFNPSPESKTVLVRRPDKVAPVAPVFTRYDVLDEGIALQWDNSSSSDVAKYELHRLRLDSNKTTKVAEWSLKELEKITSNQVKAKYTDVIGALGGTYRYMISAVDSAGNRGKTQSGEITYETGKRKAVEVVARVDREKKKVVLSWKSPDASLRVTQCYIYRSANKDPLRLYETLSDNIYVFEDTRLDINNVYTYKIQLLFSNRAKSVMTAPIIVKY